MTTRITVKRARRRGLGAADYGLALFAAAATGFAGHAMPDPVFAGLVGAAGIDAWIPAAQPPLGATARLVAVAATAAAVFAAILLLMRALNRPRRRKPLLANGEELAAVAPRSEIPEDEIAPPPFYIAPDRELPAAEKPRKRMVLGPVAQDEAEAWAVPPADEADQSLDLATLADRPLSDFGALGFAPGEPEPTPAEPITSEPEGFAAPDDEEPLRWPLSPEPHAVEPEPITAAPDPVAAEACEPDEPAWHQPVDAFDLGPFRELDEASLAAQPRETEGATISDLMRRLEAGIGRRAAAPPVPRAGEEEGPGADRLRSAIDDLQKLLAQKG
jgi:hypothetical protein